MYNTAKIESQGVTRANDQSNPGAGAGRLHSGKRSKI